MVVGIAVGTDIGPCEWLLVLLLCFDLRVCRSSVPYSSNVNLVFYSRALNGAYLVAINCPSAVRRCCHERRALFVVVNGRMCGLKSSHHGVAGAFLPSDHRHPRCFTSILLAHPEVLHDRLDPHASTFGYQTHKSLPDVLDLVVLMQ